MTPIKIFFCYAREDDALRKRLEKQLTALKRQGLIDICYDRDINAGTEWEQEIDQNLNAAQIILLLISPDFMDSDYCYGIEMERAMERHERGEAHVIPVILRPVYWQGAPFGKLQCLPTNAKSIIEWRPRDKGYFDVATGIRNVIEKITSNPSASILSVPAQQDQRKSQFPNPLKNSSNPIKELLQQLEIKQTPPSLKRRVPENSLFYGDNLDILREYIPDNSVDLIYLDPPFNSNLDSAILFKDESGVANETQTIAFEEIWHWNHIAEYTYQKLIAQAPDNMSRLIAALRELVGTNQMMAYLVMLAMRLVELYRVLKPTGSMYLHCDPTASHYLKIILDTIFIPQNFRNEISWHRTETRNSKAKGHKGLGRTRDIVLFYSKSENFTWHPQYVPYDDEYINKHYKNVEPDTGRRYRLDSITRAGNAERSPFLYELMGITRFWRYPQEKMQNLIEEGRIVQNAPGTVPKYKRYIDEISGLPLQDDWDDISSINSQAREHLGYPTQKPLALLERFIQLASNPDDIVLDPFCGCGTTIEAAQKLGRKWIGIDITHYCVALQEYRLKNAFPGIKFMILGDPQDLGSARQLAQADCYQFQWWVLSLIRAKPVKVLEGNNKDKEGADGIITFIDDNTGKAKQVLVQVKSIHVNLADIRCFIDIIHRQQAPIGVFITLEDPSNDMITEALSAGFYHSPVWEEDYPCVQIFTIRDLLSQGAQIRMPPQHGTFKQTPQI